MTSVTCLFFIMRQSFLFVLNYPLFRFSWCEGLPKEEATRYLDNSCRSDGCSSSSLSLSVSSSLDSSDDNSFRFFFFLLFLSLCFFCLKLFTLPDWDTNSHSDSDQMATLYYAELFTLHGSQIQILIPTDSYRNGIGIWIRIV